ncbi:hypothetical protein AVEN_89997-1 [Araneus ventricosus]|uniref:Uncharacterized protein n=1 Tax=Araneus ventricosus TaxID=182803 RepID=A0A4Y2DAJ0_ARAVE|nr:hypothetical protein AVEN_89997-1 [Araneus ventricosus]
MNWTLPTWLVIYPTTPCYRLPLRLTEMGYGLQGNWTPLPCLSPKRSQNLASPQKKSTTSDRPSSLLRGKFKTARNRLFWCERVKVDSVNDSDFNFV